MPNCKSISAGLINANINSFNAVTWCSVAVGVFKVQPFFLAAVDLGS